jgi:hypothetical protein
VLQLDVRARRERDRRDGILAELTLLSTRSRGAGAVRVMGATQ